jgi:hypothetical protein
MRGLKLLTTADTVGETVRPTSPALTQRDRAGQEVRVPIDEALAALEEHREVCSELLYGCPWREALESGTDRARVEAIVAALQHLHGGDDLALLLAKYHYPPDKQEGAVLLIIEQAEVPAAEEGA